jgi:uncharacterized protein (DUF433 family)
VGKAGYERILPPNNRIEGTVRKRRCACMQPAPHAERSVAKSIVTVREVNCMRRDQILTRDQDILGGTPVFTGTRVPVDTLIAHLKAGDPLEKFLADFPSVSREQAVAFLELAQQLVIQEAVDARSA